MAVADNIIQGFPLILAAVRKLSYFAADSALEEEDCVGLLLTTAAHEVLPPEQCIYNNMHWLERDQQLQLDCTSCIRMYPTHRHGGCVPSLCHPSLAEW